jgi:hypothetical protein
MTDKEKDYIAENYKGFSDEVCDNTDLRTPEEKELDEREEKYLDSWRDYGKNEFSWRIIILMIFVPIAVIITFVYCMKSGIDNAKNDNQTKHLQQVYPIYSHSI